MSDKRIFHYSSYREYLKDRLEENGPRSGLKRRASEALEVHTTFVSQVVLGKADLSLDQAEKMNQFLKHSEEESEFFLDLVIFERAATERLRSRFQKKIRAKMNEKSQIKSQLKNASELDESIQEKFYSTHLHGLLHVLSSIPEYQTRKSLIATSGQSPKVTEESIDFLLQIGVLKQNKDKIVPGPASVHLSRNSKFIRQHHNNWRLLTMQQLGRVTETDLHYSLIFSCSEKDAQKIQKSMLKHLQDLSTSIETSPSEQAYVYCFDLFQWR